MTTNPEERKRHWDLNSRNLRNWKILGRFSTKTEAQKAEIAFAKKYGCIYHAGGAGNEHDNWVVYRFEFDE